jgi:hypothetical protein
VKSAAPRLRVIVRSWICSAGALLAGLLADAYGIRAATTDVAALTAASGLLVWARMYETHTSR